MTRPDNPDSVPDPSRREFFRTFSRQTVRQAGAVVGAAAELRRTSLAAARELLDPAATPAAEADASEPQRPPSDPVEATFRSPYRFSGTELVVQDLRQLPGRVTTITLGEPSEVASAIRAGAINAGPVLAQVVAYAMVIAARRAADRPQVGRRQQMRAAAGTLRAARRDVRALEWAVDRMEARYDELVNGDTSGAEIADALGAEADAIATAATEAHLAIGRHGARLISPPAEEPINLLLHADMGPLSCGMVGMGTALIQELTDAGRGVHVWLTECAPSDEGGRISAVQFAQLDALCTVIPDSAVGWLFERLTIDAVMLRGDRVAANGDTGVLIGGLGVARLAHDAGVPVHVMAPLASVDPAAADSTWLRSDQPALTPTARLNPTSDVVPADLITSLVTEAGVLRRPFGAALAAAAG